MPKLQKIVLFLMTICVSCVGLGQVVNYDFVQPVPPEYGNILSIPPKLFGNYRDTSGNQEITVKARGIYISSNIYGSISREEIRESSKYEVRNDHIFGINEYDSLPCTLEGENYYFGLRKTTELFSFNGANTLRKQNIDRLDNNYILCFSENGYWLPMLLNFTDNKLIIYNPSFDDVENAFDVIADKFREEKEGVTRIHLHPGGEEWEKIDLSLYFSHPTVYLRE